MQNSNEKSKCCEKCLELNSNYESYCYSPFCPCHQSIPLDRDEREECQRCKAGIMALGIHHTCSASSVGNISGLSPQAESEEWEKEFDKCFDKQYHSTYKIVKECVRNLLSFHSQKLVSELKSKVRKLQDIDCACDANDCGRCEYIRKLLKKMS